jgi:NAD(P)-dependent dehydrogenase (short-subunit alcohol dehydrogenase family)
MLATEIALKGIPVRVNSIAPGVFASEMTLDTITGPEEMARVAQSLLPVPAGRSGSYVPLYCAVFCVSLTHLSRAGEIAGTVIYLSSPAGCYTNGQELVVDGSYTAVNPSTA